MTYKLLIIIVACTISSSKVNAFTEDEYLINKPCINTEVDSTYEQSFDDSIINFLDTKTLANFLKTTYAGKHRHIDNEFNNGKDTLTIFSEKGTDASIYQRAGDLEIMSVCVSTNNNIDVFLSFIAPAGYIDKINAGRKDNFKVLIVDESSLVKLYLSVKQGKIVYLKLFHLPP